MARIAIIGSGISGLTAGYLLGQEHRVSLFEASDTLGGHTATVDIELAGRPYAVDTGFIVFNDRTYPNFLKLLARIGLCKQPTEMSFSVQHPGTGLEYNGHNLASLFAQRRNLISPRFYRFLGEILRFNRLSKAALQEQHLIDQSLGQFLSAHGFSDFFAEHYILPMVAAIWSASEEESRALPLPFFLRFFDNHGLLDINDRPQWYVLPGGSRSYIPALSEPLTAIHRNTPVQRIRRQADGVTLDSHRGAEQFDQLIIACHADQALALLADPTPEEESILSQLPYRSNEVVLHHDRSLLPDCERAWASWNYRLHPERGRPTVTYNMNILQGLESAEPLCVTLNQSEAIDPNKILGRYDYAHPVYNRAALAAQQRRASINGHHRTYYCGAYWYNGFHEDGVNSALDICRAFGATL